MNLIQTIRRLEKQITFSFCLLLTSSTIVLAEGTKELQPSAGDYGFLQIYDQNTLTRPFATYNCPEEYRLNISVCNLGEKIYLGLRQNNNDVYFRLKDPNGNVVLGPTLIPAAGQGFINTHADAILGPRQVTGNGYFAIEHSPLMTGDYYIEFNPTSPTAITPQKRVFNFIDITVADTLGGIKTVKPGRLYSKNWDFQCMSDRNPFLAELYVYAKDSIVTALDFNGMQGFGFTVSANSKGCTNSGDPIADRQSRYGNQTFPEYKIFLNNPDPDCYPSGTFGEITEPSTITGCENDNRCINVYVNKPGEVEVVLNLNGVDGYQKGSTDVVFQLNVTAGHNCIPWNTRDGQGNIVPPGTEMTITVNYFNGLTHLPLFDVEHNRNGYIVNLVRPIPPSGMTKPKLYWDDSRLDIARGTAVDGLVNLEGCELEGCHRWFNRGVNGPYMETINTWWYANVIKDDISYVVRTVTTDANAYTPLGAPNDTTVCVSSLPYNLFGEVTGTSGGVWSGGEGSFSDLTDLTGVYTPSQDEINTGKASIALTSVPNSECPTVTDSMNIFIVPVPTASPTAPTSVCYNNPAVDLSVQVENSPGGVWSGGTGEFFPNNSAYNIRYQPSVADLAQDHLDFTFTTLPSTYCSPVETSVRVLILPPPAIDAGPDQKVCANRPSVSLSGSVSGATGGIWSGGSGSFSPSEASLQSDYTPAPSEASQGYTELILTSTGNDLCAPVSDTLLIEYIPEPTVNGGPDQNVCLNNPVSLSASLTGATKGRWSGGTGRFSPTDSVLNPTYTPGPGENAVGASFTLTFTALDTLNCTPVSDDITVTIEPGPSANAGPDMFVCNNNPTVNLNGSIQNATGGRWRRGSGTFNPNRRTLNAAYTPSEAEVANSAVTLILETRGNGTCNPARDTVLIIISPAPVVNAGQDISACSNNPGVTLNGTVSNASGRSWSGGSGTFSPNRNTANAVYTPTTNEIQTGFVNLSLVGTRASCLNVTDEVHITFTPAPEVNAGPDISACMNNPAVSITGAVSVASGGRWSGGTGTFQPSQDSLNVIYTASPDEIQAGFAQLTLTSIGNGSCLAEQDVVEINFTPAPQVNAGDDIQICYNNPLVTLSGTIAGASGGVWSNGAGSFSPNSSSLNATYTPTQSELEQESFFLVLTSTGNGTCNPVTDTVRVNVIPQPTIDAGPDVTVCKDSPEAELSASVSGATGVSWSGGNGSWSTPNSLIASYNPTLEEINSGTVMLSVTSTGNGLCSPVTDQVNIIINPAPFVETGPDQMICGSEASFVLNNANVENAGGVLWSTSGTGTFSPSASVINPTYNISEQDKAAGNITLTATTTDNGTCSPVSDDMVVYFTPEPVVNAGPNRTVCSNSLPVRLNGSGTPGTWTGGAGSFSPGPNHMNSRYYPSPDEITAGQVTLTLSTTPYDGCPSVSDQVSIDIISGPDINTGPDRTICGNSTQFDLTATVENASGVQWLTSGTGSFTSSTTATTSYLPSAADKSNGSIRFRVTTTGNGICQADADTVIISFSPEVRVNAGPDQTLCADTDPFMLSGSATNVTAVSWTSTGTGTFSAPNSLTTTYTPSNADRNTGNLTFTLSTTASGPCPAYNDQVIYTFTPAPTINAGPDRTICAEKDTLHLNGTATVAYGFIWTTTGTGTFSPSASSSSVIYSLSATDKQSPDISFTFSSTSQGNCKAVSDELVFTVLPKPIVEAGNDTLLCKTETSYQLNGDITSAGGGIWSGTGTGVFSDISDINSLYTFSNTDKEDGIIIFTLTSTDNDLCSAESDNITLRFTDSPELNAGPDRTVCETETEIMFTGNFRNAQGLLWASSGSGSFSPAANNSEIYYTPSPADLQATTVNLSLTTTGSGICSAVTDTVTLTFEPLPEVNAGPDQVICGDSSFIHLQGVRPVTENGTWSASGTGNFIPSSLADTTRYYPSQSDIARGRIDFTFSSEAGICPSVSDNLSVVLTPVPTSNAGPDREVCATTSGIALNGTVTVATEGRWQTSGSGTFTPTAGTRSSTYIPSPADTASGTVTLTLITTGNGSCKEKRDQVRIRFVPAPRIQAGPDIRVCADEISIPLTAQIRNASGALWSYTGSGSISPSSSALQATYAPSFADTSAGVIRFIVTTTGSGICPPAKDTLLISMDPVPFVASEDVTMCFDESGVQLNGSAANATGFIWSGGSGTFSPNEYAADPVYIPSGTDKASGTVNITVSTTGSGKCDPVSASSQVLITPPPTVDAGTDITICEDSEGVILSGSVNNAGGARWISSGTGFFFPDNETLNATYFFSEEDADDGNVTLTLISSENGNCYSAADNLLLTIEQQAELDAGPDMSVCPDVTSVEIEAVIENAKGAYWQIISGSGSFSPTAEATSTAYIPSAQDIADGTVTLLATASGTGTCNAPSDEFTISFLGVPQLNAGPDESVCATDLPIRLQGSGASAEWSGGSGTFSPSNKALRGYYTPSQAEIENGTVSLTLITINNGSCAPQTDDVTFTILPGPSVDAGPDQEICETSTSIPVSASFTNAVNVTWSTSGTGSFADPLSASTEYIPSIQDKQNGSFTLIATTSQTGICNAQTDRLTITVSPAPTINAGFDQTACVDKINYDLSASFTYATGISWTTSGSGSFGDPSSVTTIYTASPEDLAAGSVTLTATSVDNPLCNVASDDLVLRFTNPPAIDAGLPQEICSDQPFIQLNGSATGAAGGRWTSTGNGSFSPSSNVLQARYYLSEADRASGTINFEVTSTGNGTCNARTASTAVTINSKPTVSVTAAPESICEDETSISLNATITNATGVTWTSNGTGTFTPGNMGTSISYSPSSFEISNGAVRFQITSTGNPAGCSPATANREVVITPAPTVEINSGADILACESATVIAFDVKHTVAGGITWATTGDGSFSPSNSSTQPTYAPGPSDISSGQVTLSAITTENGRCQSATEEIAIQFQRIPEIAVTPADTVCSGSSVYLTGSIQNASGAFWSTPGTGSFAPSKNFLSTEYTPSEADVRAGQIEFTLTSSGTAPCPPVSEEKRLVIIKAPEADAGPDQEVCEDIQAIQLKGNMSFAADVTWSTSGTGTFSNPASLNTQYLPSSEDLASEKVLLQLSTAVSNLCSANQDALELRFTPYLQISGGPDIEICSGSQGLGLQAIVQGQSSVAWSTSGSGTFNPSRSVAAPAYIPSQADEAAGTVILTVAAGENHVCGPVHDTVQIRIRPAPIASMSGINTCYFEDGIQLQGSFQNAGSGFWNSNGTGIFSPSSFSANPKYFATAADAANGSVTLSFITSGNGICSADTSKAIVSLTPPPSADAGPDRRICRFGSAILSGNTGKGLSYQWNSESGSGIGTGKVISVTANTDTWFSLTVTDEKGCQASDTVSVTVIDPPALQLEDHYCFTNGIILDSDPQPSAGLAGSFQWYKNGMSLPLEIAPVHFVQTAGDYLILYNDGSCSVYDSSSITLPPFLSSSDKVSCEGNTTTLTTTSLQGADYEWYHNGTQITGNSNTISISVLPDTSVYFVQTTDSYGCTAEDSMIVWGMTKPVFSLADSSYCADQTILLRAAPVNIQNPGQYEPEYNWWHEGSVISTNDTLLITATGEYILHADFGECTSSDTAAISVHPLPLVAISGPEDFCSETDKSVSLDAGDGFRYLWTHNNDTSRYINVSSEGQYSVTVLNQYNCSAQDSIYIYDICPPRLFAPNAITPNNDGNNDGFKLFGKYYGNFQITIFNRWGEIIFHSEDPEVIWDGTYRGEPMPAGVYPWIITYDGINEKYKGPYRLEGKVTVIR